MPRRVRIEMAFEVDLDMVPGFGHKPESWVDYVTQRFGRGVEHYRPTLEVMNVTTKVP